MGKVLNHQQRDSEGHSAVWPKVSRVTCSHTHIYIGPLHLNSHGPTGSPVRPRDSREAQRDEEKKLQLGWVQDGLFQRPVLDPRYT